ncbi:VOC family protein [Vannielia litorea]|nr:VOC family protein [Vannielia litorea]
MLRLDHLTVIAPSLAEGLAHVHDCLGLSVPERSRHLYMGTHNHRMQLGQGIYLEIVAVDPEGTPPGRPRWFGLDDAAQVAADWAAGRRLRGWVANCTDIPRVLGRHGDIFGTCAGLPFEAPEFGFTLRDDGGLPLEGAAPSLIDHRGDMAYIAALPDLGARLTGWELHHPEPASMAALFEALEVDRPPRLVSGPETRFRAEIDTPAGPRVLS